MLICVISFVLSVYFSNQYIFIKKMKLINILTNFLETKTKKKVRFCIDLY